MIFLRLRVTTLLVLVTLTAVGVGGAEAASFIVTTTADHDDGTCNAECSLREAVLAANATPGADTISIPAGTYVLGGSGGEDLAATGDLDLRESVTIVGVGAAATILDGGGVDRVIDIVESAMVTIRDLTLRGGKVPAGDTQGGGGLLWSEPFSGKTLHLTLNGVVVTDNDSGTGDGGGINVDQDDPASALVTIVDSAVTDNTMSDGDGGGLHLCCDNLVVGIRNSTISGNTAVEDPNRPLRHGEGGGIYHCCSASELTIIESTISDNTGPTQGGGLYTCCGVEFGTLTTLQRTMLARNTSLGLGPSQGFGGGVEAEGATTIVNSTVSGNRARQDGGGIENEDVLVLRNVTLAGNEAGRGGGLFEDGAGTTLGNTLLAGNSANGVPSNCAAAASTDPLASTDGNLSSDATCGLTGAGDRQSLDPLLEALADNGGPTATHALPAESPAVDGGSNAGCPLLDQRVRARPTDGDGNGDAVCDVGAYERGSLVEVCGNAVDDDGNGLVDCDDFVCAGQPTCRERCDNCVDDDGDGAVDRDDGDDCEPPSNGGGTGVGDPGGRGKLVAACTATTQKVGVKLATAHLATLQDCVAALSTCVQRKPGDGICLTRAGDRCQRRLGKLESTVAKAHAKIVKACDPLNANELLDASGLGYLGEASFCRDLGIASLTTAADVGACLAAHHRCVAQRLVGLETPRARELLALGGVDPTTALSCAIAPADGGGRGLAANGKAAVACEQAIRKAGAKLVAGTLTLAQRCANAVAVCRQRFPDDQDCLDRARAACPKSVIKLNALAVSVTAAVDKRCNVATLGLAELLGSTGAGFQSHAALCRALGGPALDSVAALSECLLRHHRCRAGQLLELELPRVRELLSTGGVTLP